MNRLATGLTIYRKEIVDALRDRRTLLTVLASSVLMGPLVLLAISALVASLEANAEQREVAIAGLERAPTLVNFIARQTYTVKPAPADYEQRLRKATLADAVVVVPDDFEAALVRGEAPIVEIVSDSANQRSQASAARAVRLVEGFSRERALLTLALRGVSPDALEPLRVAERDLASTQTRATQITGMLPFFVLMAVLTGALNAALDTTAGERERGSLEPLLMNPAERWVLVLGKWGAVASVGMLIAVLACSSFLPGQWLLRSDTLAAMFQYGVPELLRFLVVLLPFAAAASALLMAVAIRCKTFKEAQASTTVVMLAASLLPLINVFSLGEESPWYLWVPALAQNVLMTHVLKGEALGIDRLAPPLLVCAAIAVASVWFVARTLRSAAVR
ncbi:ABC transporter permease [Rhizobacter sp. Root404]|uniref:ABC transporter permease n=1 Tax=Rhizobacter sp. Root404 TaxID=1736528 RepID=UPI0006FB747C|nr:ABC transporter permease [Rhizobacter sp. Root404]KQW35466.1 sodium ABC transporter permease [Rhizobacter sp. Root404]